MQACHRCHARKTRCDRRLPQCGACEKANEPCIHADKLRQRNLPRGHMDSLERQIQQLKAQNRALQEELARTRVECHRQPCESSACITGASSCSPQQPEQAETNADASTTSSPFAIEVGYLSLVVTGEFRYLGSSSGLGLANIINKVLSVEGGLESAFSTNEDPSNKYTVKTRTNPGPSEAALPPLDVAMTLIEAYFKHTHIAFPLLHKPSFMDTVQQIYEVSGYYDTHYFEGFVYDMVLAIGSSNLSRIDDVYAGSSVHFARAQSKLTPITALPGLQSLKVILLLAQHGIFSNLRDTAASMWHLIGIGARICFEIGLHLDCKQSEPSLTSETVSYESEMRRRCFWCLYNLDRVVSTTLGRPFAIRDDEIDIPLPSHLDDDCFGPDRNLVTSTRNRTSPFLHIIRIRRLSGEILRLFYNSSQQKIDIAIEEKLRMRRQFRIEIEAWKSDSARLCLVGNSVSDEPASTYLATEWYNAVYSNALQLLYRPSPYLPHPVVDPQDSENGRELIELLSATKLSLKSYTELYRTRRLKFSWITLHGIFVAGLAFVYTISSMIQESTLRHALPDIISILDVCRQCSHLLVAISERRDTTHQANDLFDRISQAMIRKALAASQSEGPHHAAQITSRTPSYQVECDPQRNPPEASHTSLIIPTARLEDMLKRSDPANFSIRGEATIPSDLLPIWPFEFPFGPDETQITSQNDWDTIPWRINL